MEKWQEEFEKFMYSVGEYEEIGVCIAMGMKNRGNADAIMNYIKENNLDAHNVLEDDKKFEKYQDFLKFCVNLPR